MKKEIRKIQNPPKGVLVPLVRNFMAEGTPSIESPADVQFHTDLLNLMVAREIERGSREKGFYSPSSLGDHCLRKAFLGRHAVRQEGAPSPYNELTHYYFITGNYAHIKWQFILHKMEKWIGNSSIFQVHGYEIPVQSKHGDHRGTIDVVASVYNEPLVLDFKGLNTFAARKVGYGRIPVSYRIQVSDYMVLWNADKNCPFKISRGLLVAEDKTGGENYLQEVVVSLKKDGPKVRRRLDALREHEQAKTIPPPSCKSLKDKSFIGCQFRDICHDEVAAVGKAHTESMRAMLKDQETPTATRISTVLKRKR